MGLAFGVMSEKIGLGGLGGLVGFFPVAGIIIALGACVGAAIGYAIYREGEPE